MPKLYPGYREEIRRKIIAEAFTLFLERGFEKTKMEDVAARLGVTKAAIYRYFSNKDELFLASIAETAVSEFQDLFITSFTGDDLAAGASIFFDRLLDYTNKYIQINLKIAEVITMNRYFDEGSRYQREMIAPIQRFFEDLSRQGMIRRDIMPQDITILCLAFANGLIHYVTEGMAPSEAKRIWLIGFTELTGIMTKPIN